MFCGSPWPATVSSLRGEWAEHLVGHSQTGMNEIARACAAVAAIIVGITGRPCGPQRRDTENALFQRVRWSGWGLAAVASVVVLTVGGTFIYIHLIEGPAPAPLTLKNVPATTSAGSGAPHGQTAAADPVAGTWRVTTGSVVGYRVQEVLFGQNNPPSAGQLRSPAISRSGATLRRQHLSP